MHTSQLGLPGSGQTTPSPHGPLRSRVRILYRQGTLKCSGSGTSVNFLSVAQQPHTPACERPSMHETELFEVSFEPEATLGTSLQQVPLHR